MGLIEQRLSEIEKTLFTREQAKSRLDDYFTLNPELGEVQGEDYQGYFIDPFGIDYHAFGVTVSGNGIGIDWWGAAVTREMVSLCSEHSLYQDTLENAQQLS